ncbi:MAG: hypothetical protein A2Y62_21215 [Candidatus Fischerbacteria bacterium RBG_13_37_8]|uniref:Uncharacterized protein n=1 Tax=Candidatus Fischerbacteria bacterium RBG_13_37_8 TaxID=1817863 RepID=A0A1F5V4X8_9BACT|nr:MAG: hypothetical protein A2Y62_21215 [Candidatus Fischerbacteria bacterium RBG_13_37_8]HJX50431.1 hypothetical protein [Candidatus Nanoarchaeia archaeon]
MDNQLQTIVQSSGLDKIKADFILQQFQDYFKIAGEWELKAKSIVVTDESQTTDMEMARVGRLFLKEKRVAIEKARKSLKEQALREGKAIDGIANVLKALIVPIEEYLDKQEHFAENKAKEEAERKRIEEEQKAEEERIRQEKIIMLHNERKQIVLPYLSWWDGNLASANLGELSEEDFKNIVSGLKLNKEEYDKKQEEIRFENEKLKIEKEKAELERKKLEEENRKEREKLETEKKVIEDKARKDKEEAERFAREEKEKQEAEKRAIEEKARQEIEKQAAAIEIEKSKARLAIIEADAREQKLREEAEKAKQELANQKEMKCPYCQKTFFA